MKSSSQPNASELSQDLPPTRLILDLDRPLLRQALLEILDLLAHPPPALEQPGDLRQWRCRVWVRAGYLLSHHSCSLHQGNQQADMVKLGQHHSVLAQRLLEQDRALAELAPR